jgi:hypothetical protein
VNAEQKAILLQYLESYLGNPQVTNEGEAEDYSSFDKKRIDCIPEIKAVIDEFLSGEINIQQFKESHESKCREHPYWGFKGFSGQMQVNQFANNIRDPEKELILRKAIAAPHTEVEAFEKISSFVQYVADCRAKSENRQALPRVASVKYVLTYFWEIQDHTKWPVFYNSSEKILEADGLLNPEASEAQSYLDFLKATREILSLYQLNLKGREIRFPFWFVEHTLWAPYLSSRTSTGTMLLGRDGAASPAEKRARVLKSTGQQVAHEWLPPIVADLEELAFNRESEWSTRNSVRPEKALETKIRIAFTLMGFEATELGQGTGRQPDGFAISLNGPDGDYAIVYDAKAREERFNVGTADREIFEYITKKREELKKRRVGRFYFLVVSSDFDENPTSLNRVKDVFRRARIPIVMMKAADLMFLVEEKLKDTDLTHDRLEPLFLETGILKRDKIVDLLGLR